MFGLLKSKKQDWAASVQPSGQSVEVKAGDNLLNAALMAGLAWPHDCRVGSCGTCKCTLKEGQIKSLADFSYVLDGDQLDSGMILACQSVARSDLVVEVALDDDSATGASSPSSRIESVQGKITRVNNLTDDIVEVTVSTEQSVPMEFIAGQYAEISTSQIDKPRSYSFATAPERISDNSLSFFIRLVPGGEFTEWLFGANRRDTPVTVRGPFGSFRLRSAQGLMICIAGGSGLAPLKSLLESACDNKVSRDVLFLFGARTQQDLYCLDELEQIKADWAGSSFDFVPVLSEEASDSDWQGKRGMVTDCLRENYIDTGDLDVGSSQGYLCGPPPMIDAAIELLNTAGLSESEIFFDKFLDASSMPEGR